LQLAAPSFLHRPAGSGLPAATAEQVPSLPATAHDMQLPEHAVVQHTPCAHTCPAHSVSELQTAPGGLSPHEPPMQLDGGAQSALLVHDALQALLPQTYGVHATDATVTHRPAPSQPASGVSVVPPGGQLAGRHTVPCG
jgi:hypothetical protein